MTKYFKAHELVDKATFELFGSNAKIFFRPEFLKAIDGLRELAGKPIIVNTYNLYNGNLQYRGFRPRSCHVGGEYSQHRLGNAIDFNIVGLSHKELHRWVYENEQRIIDLGFTTVEDFAFTKSWVHLDMRPIEVSNELYRVKP